MSEETPEKPRRRKIVWAGWMLVASGLIVLVPMLGMATSHPEGGGGYMGDALLMLLVFIPISSVLAFAGVLLLILALLELIPSSPRNPVVTRARSRTNDE
jgi:uncharacterized membrane protein